MNIKYFKTSLRVEVNSARCSLSQIVLISWRETFGDVKFNSCGQMFSRQRILWYGMRNVRSSSWTWLNSSRNADRDNDETRDDRYLSRVEFPRWRYSLVLVVWTQHQRRRSTSVAQLGDECQLFSKSLRYFSETEYEDLFDMTRTLVSRHKHVNTWCIGCRNYFHHFDTGFMGRTRLLSAESIGSFLFLLIRSF